MMESFLCTTYFSYNITNDATLSGKGFEPPEELLKSLLNIMQTNSFDIVSIRLVYA